MRLSVITSELKDRKGQENCLPRRKTLFWPGRLMAAHKDSSLWNIPKNFRKTKNSCSLLYINDFLTLAIPQPKNPLMRKKPGL